MSKALTPDEWKAKRLKNFWDKVDIRGPDECWLWKASTNGVYGWFAVQRRGVGAHKHSWYIHYGPVPSHLWVLHKCDTPKCVNPRHLFLGDRLDNVYDMKAKGRNREYGHR